MHRRNFLQNLLLLPLALTSAALASRNGEQAAPDLEKGPDDDLFGLARWRRAARWPVVDIAASDSASVHFLARAIAENQPVSFRYASGELARTRREVTPGALFRVDGFRGLYCSGYCHRQQAERTFRVERMSYLDRAELHPPIYGALDDSPLSTTVADNESADAPRSLNERPNA